jgi:hypothetical protein
MAHGDLLQEIERLSAAIITESVTFLHDFAEASRADMAEVLFEYQPLFTDPDGRGYRARACGGEMNGGMWEGWIEFAPLDGGKTLRSRRETTQPNRTDALYWATGLSGVYLEGSFNRVLNPLVVAAPPSPKPPAYEDPARPYEIELLVRGRGEAILDPFAVFDKGEDLLLRQLGALSPWHLVNIIEAYDLSDEDPAVLGRLTRQTLVELIVSAVRRQVEAKSAK